MDDGERDGAHVEQHGDGDVNIDTGGADADTGEQGGAEQESGGGESGGEQGGDEE